MTLQEWSNKTKEPIRRSEYNQCVYVYYPTEDAYTELFHLSDYRVSTVGGNIVWMVPTRQTQEVSNE